MRGALKRAERAVRLAFFRAAARVALDTRRTVPPPWASRQYRVLYVKHEAIGDMIMATGMLRAIALAQPAVLIDVLTFPSHGEVLAGNPRVRRTITFQPARRRTYAPSLLRELRRQRYDVVIDGLTVLVRRGQVVRQEVMPRTIALCIALRAPYRIGLAGRPNDFIFNLPVEASSLDRRHHVESAAALATPFGVDPLRADLRPEIHLSEEERAAADQSWQEVASRGRRLLINTSTADPDRRWPGEKWIALIRELTSRWPDLRPLAIGSPEDRSALMALSAASGVAWLAPRLREAFALVADADCLITPNTSIAHAASAFVTPTVVIQPAMYETYVPYRTPGAVVAAEEAGVSRIEPRAVFDAVERTLSTSPGHSPAGRKG